MATKHVYSVEPENKALYRQRFDEFYSRFAQFGLEYTDAEIGGFGSIHLYVAVRPATFVLNQTRNE